MRPTDRRGGSADTGLLAQDLDDLLDPLMLIDLAGTLMGQIRVLATEKPNTQHEVAMLER